MCVLMCTHDTNKMGTHSWQHYSIESLVVTSGEKLSRVTFMFALWELQYRFDCQGLLSSHVNVTRVNMEIQEIRDWMELLEPQDCPESLVETDWWASRERRYRVPELLSQINFAAPYFASADWFDINIYCINCKGLTKSSSHGLCTVLIPFQKPYMIEI